MTGILATAFEILAALALGFVMGRIWQIRYDERQRRTSFTVPPVARIPLPRGARPSGLAPVPADRLVHGDTADLLRT
jgi:hypothetical protein